MIESTATSRDDAGNLVGSCYPTSVHPVLAGLLPEAIDKFEAALIPMWDLTLTKNALVRLLTVLHSRQADEFQIRIRLEVMLEHLRKYPEWAVLKALHEAEGSLKFFPAPTELIALVEAKLAPLRDCLRRMRWLLKISQVAALEPPRGKTYSEMNDAERTDLEAKLSDYRGLPPSLTPAHLPEIVACRRYVMPEDGWPAEWIDVWCAGFLDPRCGLTERDCPFSDGTLKLWWTEGNRAASGVALGELTLTDYARDRIDAYSILVQKWEA